MENFASPRAGSERHPLNIFQDEVAVALIEGVKDDRAPLPIIETTKDVIQFFNRANMKGVEEAGYFVYHGCIVCEVGNTEKVIEALNMTFEEKMHGKKLGNS